MRLVIFAAAICSSLVQGANAAEEKPVCVKYRKDFKWSQTYSVQATVKSGSELSAATGEWSRFTSFNSYAVIFWGQNQATILELPPLSMNDIPMFETDVEDADGRKWKISKRGTVCF